MSENINPHIADIMTQYEAEGYISKLEPIHIKEYGSESWFAQADILLKLNMQVKERKQN